MKSLIITIVILCTQVCIAQEIVDIEKMILAGKENLHKARKADDIDQLMASKKYFIDLLDNKKHEELIHYYIGYADFNLFYRFLQKKDKKAAKKFIYDGIEHLEKTVELKDDFAEGYALLGWLFFNKIAVNRLSMMSSGSKSEKSIEKALELAPENPRVLCYAGIIRFNTPKMFGGSKDDGIELLQKSVDSFETFKPQQSYYPDHSREEANLNLGICYMMLDNLDAAQHCFDKVLEINPDNEYVKNELLVQLKEKKIALNKGKQET